LFDPKEKAKRQGFIGKIVKLEKKAKKMFEYGRVRFCIGLRIRRHEEVFKKIACRIGIYQNLLEVFKTEK